MFVLSSFSLQKLEKKIQFFYWDFALFEFAAVCLSAGQGDKEMRAAAAAAVRVVVLMCLISFFSHVDVADGR